MSELKQTVLFDAHVKAGATMVDFGGWNMPIQYPTGIIAEHLACRKGCGIFDVSHMGRIRIRGKDRLAFVQYVLTNDASKLKIKHAQYTIIADENGCAIDDAYLYRFELDEYLLVINAGNIEKDMAHLRRVAEKFDVELKDISYKWGAIAVQGPKSNEVLAKLADCEINEDPIPHNRLHTLRIAGKEVYLGITGYTGEPIGYELYVHTDDAEFFWNRLVECGATPIGLGARDTLRMEAVMPLYGHEMGDCKLGGEISIYAVPLARFAVSVADQKGDFIGKDALMEQRADFEKIQNRDYADLKTLHYRTLPIGLTGKGVLRAGCDIYDAETGEAIGYVTSGTMIPYYETEGEGETLRQTDVVGKRSIGMAYIRSNLRKGHNILIDIRGKKVPGVITGRHIDVKNGKFAKPVLF